MLFQRILLIAAGFFILSLESAIAVESAISAERLQQEISSESPLILLDVRSNKEFKRGHLQGAVHIPLKKLKKKLVATSRQRTEGGGLLSQRAACPQGHLTLTRGRISGCGRIDRALSSLERSRPAAHPESLTQNRP